ncbi:hypothetical protein Hypma_003115 [Hypsizygus marmoreus]|uniref:Uncharacterized protein n=1 Tax=Hypsizygus marmoreus TaxID=39966 RepID=A0A369J8Z9_HYPMA|nr:hypothetical protein Hypma_003115 [Hypsizygus marmoreus]
MLECGSSCPRKFETASQGALSRHRKSCPGYQQHTTAGHAHHKRVVSGRIEKKNGQLKDQKARILSNDTLPIAGSSASAPQPMDIDSPVENIPSPPMLRTPSPPPPPKFTAARRPQRRYKLPARYRDILPEPPLPAVEPEPEPLVRHIFLLVRNRFQTTVNSFGLWRDYLYHPSHDPDAFVSPEDLYRDRHHVAEPHFEASAIEDHQPAHPHANESIALLSQWQNSGSSSKSDQEMNRLVNDVLLHPEFRAEDLKGFNAQRENRRADEDTPKSSYLEGFTETSVDIEVPSGDKNVPPRHFSIPGLLYCKLTSVIRAAFADPLAAKFHFSPYKLFHKSSSTGEDERVFSELYDSDTFIEAHDKVQRAPLPPDDPDCKHERVVAALMLWSDSTHLANFGTAKLWPIYLLFGNLSKYIRAQPNSGATHHLAYIPSLPDSIQDELASSHSKWGTQKKDILTHCRRELMHAVWKFLLDDEFIHAYTYGIVIKCHDGIERRVYPRIFTYSADYPEKVLLATIRDKGLCPCPRCLVRKSQVDRMGYVTDMKTRVDQARKYLWNKVKRAREYIYSNAFPINGVAVNDLLKPTSSVPTVNAFVDRLGFDFDPSKMLVVDLMHEFELGIWKALFTHLIRMLYAAAPNGRLVTELDRRFRQMPTFGNSTIRRFANNASEMKKLAAWDFEDLLQCAIPAFEGLLDEPHNLRLMKLLYRTAEWHAFAKLRLQTDATLMRLEQLTKEFGLLMRQFRDLSCTQFKTTELPREVAARGHRVQKKQVAKALATTTTPSASTSVVPTSMDPVPAVMMTTSAVPTILNNPISDAIMTDAALPSDIAVLPASINPVPATTMTAVPVAVNNTSSDAIATDAVLSPDAVTPPPVPEPPTGPAPGKTSRKLKTLNLLTYKFHALGDYVQMIRQFGGTDSFSTQLGELAHRLVKRLYALTNKRAATKQIGKRVRRLQKARLAMERKNLHDRTHQNGQISKEDVVNDLTLHHRITYSKNHPLDLFSLVQRNSHDPAYVRFIPKLQDHILGCLLEREFDGDAHEDFNHEDRNTVRVVGNKICQGNICRINYTTYDIRRDEDSINPRSHPDIMVRSPETGDSAEPYWYARVIGVFHAMVSTSHPLAHDRTIQCMEFLWVRWFGVEPGYRCGFRQARLPKVGFVESTDDYAFTFLDPAHIIRGCHLIPAFAAGCTSNLFPVGQSAARVLNSDDTDDWANFYVGIFVDRDMMMQHYGGGIGHHENSVATPQEDTEPDEFEEEVQVEDPNRETENDDSDSESDGSSDSDGDESSDEDESGSDTDGPDDDEDGAPYLTFSGIRRVIDCPSDLSEPVPQSTPFQAPTMNNPMKSPPAPSPTLVSGRQGLSGVHKDNRPGNGEQRECRKSAISATDKFKENYAPKGMLDDNVDSQEWLDNIKQHPPGEKSASGSRPQSDDVEFVDTPSPRKKQKLDEVAIMRQQLDKIQTTREQERKEIQRLTKELAEAKAQVAHLKDTMSSVGERLVDHGVQAMKCSCPVVKK